MGTDQQDFIKETELKGLFIIERPTFPDDRGFFREAFRKADLEARAGYSIDFVQANHSRSVKNTLRGIHAAPWHKLINVTRGDVQAVLADMRPDSETFGRHISLTIGDSNRVAVFIPPGIGNSFAVLSDEVDYTYLTTEYWAPGKEFTVRYNDPDLNINWEVSEPVVSERDQTAATLRETFADKFN